VVENAAHNGNPVPQYRTRLNSEKRWQSLWDNVNNPTGVCTNY